MTFNYHDHLQQKWLKDVGWVAPIVFTCQSQTIMDADLLYKQAKQKDVTKQPHIQCQIIQENHLTSR